jgi:hypothetical protein
MDLRRYLRELREHGRDWWWWKGRLAARVGARLGRRPGGRSIFSEEWDSLIILDDCRYDVFAREYARLYPERVERRVSLGENTRTFLQRDFTGGDFSDIVYVSANPFADRLLDGKVGEIVSLWDRGWDEGLGSVDPEAVYAAALKAAAAHAGRRIIIHFLQPHHPYPNGTGVTGFRQALTAYAAGAGTRITCDLGRGRTVPWPYFGFRRLPFEMMEQGYLDNLRLVLPIARRLADRLPGRTVITSDHGEAFGERISPLLPLRVYGHPPGIRMEATVAVPWVALGPEDKRPGEAPGEPDRLKERDERRACEAERIRSRIRGLPPRGGL